MGVCAKCEEKGFAKAKAKAIAMERKYSGKQVDQGCKGFQFDFSKVFGNGNGMGGWGRMRWDGMG